MRKCDGTGRRGQNQQRSGNCDHESQTRSIRQNSRSCGISTSSRDGVVAFFVTVLAVLLAIILPWVNAIWNTLSSVDQSTAELRSEVTALRSSLEDTPDELVRLLEDLEE